jgi:hypothetical protein
VGEWVKARGRLQARETGLLRCGLPLGAALLAGAMMWWWLVPRPELAALSLPRTEGYIWRPYSGRNVLLLRSTNLQRLHNLDTLASALRYRGINRLHGLIWLDEAPGECLLPDWPGSESLPGDSAPGNWDMAWLGTGRQVWGARLALGHGVLLLIWDMPARCELPALLDRIGTDRAVLSVMSLRTWRKLDEQDRIALSGAMNVFVLANDKAEVGTDVWQATHELRFTPAPNGIKAREFAPLGF